jgi:hypothetical protein
MLEILQASSLVFYRVLDLKSLKDTILAKANNVLELFILLLKQEVMQGRRQSNE